MKTQSSLRNLFDIFLTAQSAETPNLGVSAMLIIFMIIFLCPAPCALSQVPQGFNYQAIARDESGAVLSEIELPVRIGIIYGDIEPTLLWLEQHVKITNSFGLFALTVGDPAAEKIDGKADYFSDIDWKLQPMYMSTSVYYKGSWHEMGQSQLWTVPYSMVSGNLDGTLEKLSVQGTTTTMDEPLFEVRNNEGKLVFAVYNKGVRVHVDDGDADADAKGVKGGFAVGGFGTDKGEQQYLKVYKDSTRIYVNNTLSGKKSKGGFAVGGYDVTKAATGNYLDLTPENYFIGHESGIYTTGLYNSFFGYQAGRTNTSGSGNIFLGYRAGFSNTTGNYNVLLGNNAGSSNKDGYGNIFIGDLTGQSNTSGFFNVFIGEWAGLANTTASRNVFIGQYTGRNNTIGQANVFIGQQSGEANTTGSFNLFAGRASGNFNTIGQLNTFLGINSGNANTTGNENVNLGGESGKWNSTGSNNVNLGTGAGFSNTDGSNNIIIGHYAGVSLTTGSSNIFIGPGAGGGLTNTSNKLFIENSTADFNNALIYGEFDNNKLRFNGNVGISTDPGNYKLLSIDSRVSNDDPAIVGQHNVTPYYGIGVKGTGGYIGVFGEATLAGDAYRYGVYGSASGGNTYNYGVYGTASGTYAYAGYFAGNVYVTGNLSQGSDKSLKKNIMPLSGSLEKVLGLQGVSYEWKSEQELKNLDLMKNMESKPGDDRSFNFPSGSQIGVIAQDVEKIVPELVMTGPDGLKSVDYIKMIPLLIEAIKEQQQEINSLKSELAAVKAGAGK